MAYDIATATFTQTVLNVVGTSGENVPSAMLFNDTGSTLYVMGSGKGEVQEYPLSTPYDISTAGAASTPLVVSTTESSPRGMLFNNDGSVLYVVGDTNNTIYAYPLSTAYDISTAGTPSSALNVGGQLSTPQALIYNNDGTALYVVGLGAGSVYEYTLSTPYDISTGSYTQVALDISAKETNPTCLLFNGNGSVLYVMGLNSDAIHEYTLSTAYDVSTGSFAQTALDVSTQDGAPTALLYDDAGVTLYMLGYGSDSIHEYALQDTSAKGVAQLEVIVTDPPEAKGTANLEVVVENPKAKGVAWLKLVVSDTGKGVANLSVEVSVPTGQGVAPLSVTVAGQGKGSAPLRVQVIDTTSPHWQASVILDGVDITARITGEPRVSEAVDSSTLFEVDMLPPAGPFDPLAWVGDTITLDYLDCTSSATERWRERQYTGVVAEPSHNPDTGIVTLTCTTDLQGRFTDMDRAAIDAVVGGRYSPHVFDDQASNWQYAQDRLSTRTAHMWIDADGILRVQDWTAKGTPDITFTDAERVAESTRITRSDKAQLINTVQIDLDFRFERFKQRNVRYRFHWNDTICAYLKAQFPLPEKAMVESAANGGGWDLLGRISYTDPWPPDVYDCGRSETGTKDFRVWGYTLIAGAKTSSDKDTDLTNGISAPMDLSAWCIGASFTLGQRWAQTVTETYGLTVTAPNSISGNGQRSETLEYGITAESEPNYWENDTNYRFRITGSGATTQVGGAISGAMPAGAVELSNGDWLYEASEAEKTGRAAMQAAQLCALDVARVDILNRHRQNRVRFSVIYQPGIRLGLTARLVTPYVTATGVIVEIERRFDMTRGRPTLDITLAVSRAGAAGIVTETPLATVDAPASDPLTVYDRLVYLPFRIGGRTDSPAYDEDWDGVITNYAWDPTATNPFSTDPDNPQTVIYPEAVKVNTQEIGDADRQAVSAQTVQTFEIDIPNDELTEVA